jgi:pimeloyl-ACP methyl ester carboxylesterase
MRDKHGEDSGVIAWVATNLYHTDPDVLSAVMDESFTADSVMEEILPTIRCPVLLLQADPAAGGVMTEMELNWAMALLPRVQQVRLEGVGHFLFAPEKEPALRVIEQSLRPLESK